MNRLNYIPYNHRLIWSGVEFQIIFERLIADIDYELVLLI